MRKNEQMWFLASLQKRSEIVRILVLAMTTAGVGASRSNFNFSEKLLLVFRCFTNKMVILGVVFRFVKNKVINLSFKDFLTDPNVTSRDQCRLEIPCWFGAKGSSSRLSNMHAGTSIQRDRFKQTSLCEVCPGSMHWQRLVIKLNIS